MDSFRVFQSSSNTQFSLVEKRIQSLYNNTGIVNKLPSPRISIPFRSLGFRNRSNPVCRIVSAAPPTEMREEEKEMKKTKSKSQHGKLRLRVRLDYQVEYGEHIVILGSKKELGSWKKNVPMHWTENGWVCDLEMKGGESVEFKFVIVRKDESLMWEGGDNRVLELPKGGSFEAVCRWDATGENVELLPLDLEQNMEEVDGNGSAGGGTAVEVEMSPLVGQWQGKDVSFMRSNEHRNRETERKWGTSGVEGVALKLVEGDQNGSNWWRKLEVVRGLLVGSLQIKDRLGALVFSAIYLKLKVDTAKLCPLGSEQGTRWGGLGSLGS